MGTSSSHTRSRPGALVVLVASMVAAVLLLGACGAEPAEFTSPTTTEDNPRLPLQDLTGAVPTESSTIVPAPPGGFDISSNNDDVDGGEGDEEEGDSDQSSEPDVPGPEDLIAAEISGVNNCVAITSAVARLYVQAVGGALGADLAAERGAELKALIPAFLHPQVDIIVDSIEAVTEVGPLDSDAFEQPAYKAAEASLQDWITGGCGPG